MFFFQIFANVVSYSRHLFLIVCSGDNKLSRMLLGQRFHDQVSMGHVPYAWNYARQSSIVKARRHPEVMKMSSTLFSVYPSYQTTVILRKSK